MIAAHDTQALAACPFCGSTACELSDTLDHIEASIGIWDTVICNASKGGCGMRSGYYDSTEEAIAAWNRRATLAAGSQAVQATEAMADAVRPLIVAIEIAGRTYGSVRNHCERAGMDVAAWPDWARNEPAGAHFTKAACALLIWHCMQRAAAPLQPLAGGEG